MNEIEFNHKFPVWGIREKSSQQLVGYISAALLHADNSKNTLPNDGWSFAANSYADKTMPNCICLLAANVHADFRQYGFSEALIEKAKHDAKKKYGFNYLIAPVRPTLKYKFSELTMSDYLSKRTPKGEFFDPWIQSHISQGAQVLNICTNSVIVKASISKWQHWTGMEFEKSGNYTIPKALAQLQVDLEKNIGVYQEPNVWVRYSL
jgi:hypothetical protein